MQLVTDNLPLIADVTGVLGAVGVILSYAILTFELMPVNVKYHLFNFCAAMLMMVSLYVNFNLGSFVIECFWLVLSITGIVRLTLKKRKPVCLKT
jgi:multidrug transporter EmrE-like cation transporter